MQICELQLATHHSLSEMTAFYSALLNEAPVKQMPEQSSFQVGGSLLTFKQSPEKLPGSYHFAINIPENQFDAAKRWVSGLATLLKDNTGDDTFYLKSWDAHMLYFYDPADNIVELIARHRLPNASKSRFTGRSLLSVSEVGIAAADVVAQVSDIQASTGAVPYCWSGNSEFAPVGDAQGLFVVVKQGRIWFPDTGLKAAFLPMTVVVENKGQRCTLSFPN